MLLKYLLNLYKNLNLYNLKNNKELSEGLFNKIINMSGGTRNQYNTVFLELFDKIKNDIEILKSSKNINQEDILVKFRTYQVFVELYQYYIAELMTEHQTVSDKIIELDRKASQSSAVQIQDTINEINTIFDNLLKDN